MKETPLQILKNQLIAQLEATIQNLELQLKIKEGEIQTNQDVIQEQKAYINELEKSQKLQHDYQELMRKENFLMSKKLKDMHSKLIDQDKIIRLYQVELNKEISWKELTDSLETLRIKLEIHLEKLLINSQIQPLINQKVEQSLRPYHSALIQLESIDWSTLQDNELSGDNVLKTLNDLNKI